MKTQHRLAGDALYHSNNGGKAQLPPAHVCFLRRRHSPVRAEGLVAETSLSALCLSHKAGLDSKVLSPQTQCGWPAQASSQTATEPPAISGYGSVTDAASALHPGLCEIVWWFSEVNNSCIGSREGNEKEGGTGPIFRRYFIRTATLCYLLSESLP